MVDRQAMMDLLLILKIKYLIVKYLQPAMELVQIQLPGLQQQLLKK
jgi:hypothetical protein